MTFQTIYRLQAWNVPIRPCWIKACLCLPRKKLLNPILCVLRFLGHFEKLGKSEFWNKNRRKWLLDGILIQKCQIFEQKIGGRTQIFHSYKAIWVWQWRSGDRTKMRAVFLVFGDTNDLMQEIKSQKKFKSCFASGKFQLLQSETLIKSVMRVLT